MMLEKFGQNGYGHQFWKLRVPEDAQWPNLEIYVQADERGISFGGELIPWADIDAAREQIQPRS